LAAASDPAIRAVDATQFDVGEGPAHDAFAQGRPVLADDISAEAAHWPGFAPAAAARGICAVHAFPLQLGAVRFGALTCWSDRPRTLSSAEVRTCLLHADVATSFLLEKLSGVQAEPAGQTYLDEAVEIRTVVYHAQGVTKVNLGVDLAEALARMRAAAYADGITLNRLAEEILDGRRTLTDDSPDPTSDAAPQPRPPPG
jgi:hypothetical protein